MSLSPRLGRLGRLAWIVVGLAVGLALAASPAYARRAVDTAAHQLSSPVHHRKTFHLQRRATHIAVHWRGAARARVRAAFSRDGRHYGRRRRVQLDEVGAQRRNGEIYGALMVAPRVRAVRVWSDQRLTRLSVLALTDLGPRRSRRTAALASSVAQPGVVPRSGWGADESLRFDSKGNEIWPPAFWQIQKLIVHHTATQNNDPDPTATVRSIYYYHAITQGWGDIGYNFLIDESGSIYEGRHSRTYAPGEAPTGEDLSGNGVTGAHSQGYNSGTVGIALLGTLTDRDATPLARNALERLLAWKADAHGLDPQGASLYTNPVSGLQATFPNIAGHRDVAATECPGSAFYATLPTIRTDVAARIAADTTPPSPPTGLSATAGDGAVSLDWSDSTEPDLSGYRIYRRNADGTWPSSPLATSFASGFVDHGVTNGTAYAYRVTAYDGNGNESSPSSVASATPLGYPRPGGATPLRVPLVPAFGQCAAPNSTHFGPLDMPSCTPPALASSLLTTASLGKQTAFARFRVMPGNPATTADEADLDITASATDVKRASDGSDYAGDLILKTLMRITDRANGFGSVAATVQDLDFSAPVTCTATADTSTAGSCGVNTTADTLVPGFAKEGKRAVISTFSVKLLDAGPDGSITPSSDACPPTCGTGDERPYLDQGIFAP